MRGGFSLDAMLFGLIAQKFMPVSYAPVSDQNFL